MIREALILMKEVNRLMDLLPLLDTVKEKTLTNISAVENLADTALVCREIEDTVDAFMKKVHEVSNLAQASGCFMIEHNNLHNIKTEYCTASPNPKIWFKLPGKREYNPEWFDHVMESIGVPPETSRLELVRLHPPKFIDYCTQLLGEGLDPPAGIDPKQSTAVDLRLKILKRKKLTDAPVQS